MQLPEKIALLQKLRADQARLNAQESELAKDIAIELGVVPVGVSVIPATIPKEGIHGVRIKRTKPRAVPRPMHKKHARVPIGKVEAQEIKAMHKNGVANGGLSAKAIAKARGINVGRVNRVLYGLR